MKRLLACISTRTRLTIMVIGLSFLCSVIYSMPVSAAEFNLSYIGPASSNDRYNLTGDTTHPRTTLRIPVYFKYNPGIVGVDVFDVYYGRNASDGALFNGYYNKSGPGDGHFNIGGFYYESSTGMWRADITAQLTKNYGQLAVPLQDSSLYQFRLRLSNHDGIIAYAGGWASQANQRYRIEYNGKPGGPGGFDEEELRMSLPCDITNDVQLGPGQPHQLILFDLDQPDANGSWGKQIINGGEDIYVAVYDETEGGREVVKYDGPSHNRDHCGDDCMGNNGTLSVTMVMKPGHKYRIKVWPNWVNNLIEYHLPFDNISYATECEPKIDMRAAVDYIDEAGHKRASAQGRYDSQNNIKSRSDVFVFDQRGHNARATWSSEGISPDPAIIRKEDAKVTPGKFLTWWFRAHNVSGYPPPDETDFANFRMTLNKNPSGSGWTPGSTSGWDEMVVYPPRRATNWFRPSEKGGKLDRNNPQVTWGCNEWGANCVDYHRQDWNKGVSFSESINYHYRYQVKAGDAGKALCQRVRNSWPVGQDWKERFTPWACAYVPYDYPPPDEPPGKDKHSGVVPTTKASKDKVQAGDTVTFDYMVENPTGPTRTRPFQYHNYTFILKRGTSLPADKDDRPTYPMSWYGDGVSCKGGRSLGWRWNNNLSLSAINPCVGWDTGRDDEDVVLNVGGSNMRSKSYGIYGSGWLAQPGDRICSYIAVDNNWSVKNDQSADTFRASNIACAVVTKSPNLNLSGSDSYADKGFRGASVSKSDKVLGTDKRGSYSQYGLLTGNKDKVTNFGSAGYTTADGNYHSLACKLSYANTGNVKDDCNDLSGLQPAGLFKKSLSTPSSTNAKQLSGGSSVDLSSLLSGSYKTTSSGSLNIRGYLGKGIHITIFAEQADVTITGDIDAYAGPYAMLSDIPSFTIRAKNIKVEPWVTLITGTYVAKGRFESCNGAQDKSADLGMRPDSKCQQKLKVNGAIVSENSPIFRRTFGAGNLQEDNQWETDRISSTAEWINYTPNLWLTTSNGSSGNKLEGLTTTQVTNLPVRY